MGNTLTTELSAVSARVFRAARQLASAPIANTKPSFIKLSIAHKYIY
jgi:hypothetical protein